MKMKFILLATVPLAMLAAIILFRCRFPFKDHPNTEWIIYLLQKYLAGNGEP
jgi:hypothetical protein